jgi:CO dehydrogenase/acetyl-CoA synthase gamma subunit (corrinoid Fe-S protein)
MSQLNNPLAIYKLLPKSNCKLCGSATCLAFAAEVIKGQKLNKCPHLESELIEKLDEKIIRQTTPEEQLIQVLIPLKRELATLDFSSSAERLGAALLADKLSIKCLGKDFIVDPEGNILSECHINVWVSVPLLNYVIYSSGREFTGKWVPFRELSNETVWDSFYVQRFERPLKQLIDIYPDLIEDMIYIFCGKPVETSFSFDISLVLYPLPKVPMLICYTRAQDELESKLNVFFDSSAEDNLKLDSIYRLSVGLLVMFQKIASRHA